MALKNPYSLTEHRVFKRTFLQQTEVNIKFSPAIEAAVFRERIVPFAQKYFGFDISAKSEPDSDSARIEAVGEQKVYFFGPDFARLIVGPESYDSFTETILHLLPALQAFLSEVAQIETPVSLNVSKRNVWPFKTENAYDNFTDAIRYVFNRQYVEDMCSYTFTDNPQPVQLSKKSTDNFSDNIRLDRRISAAISDDGKIYLELNLSAIASGVPIGDISADSVVLNDIIYNNFIEYISADIIDLMNN